MYENKYRTKICDFTVCKEIVARKHTATHKPTSAQPLIVTTMTHVHALVACGAPT